VDEKTYPVSHYQFLSRCGLIAAELSPALELLGPAIGEDDERPEEVWEAFDVLLRKANAASELWFDMDDKPDPETYPPHDHSGPYYDLYWAVADVAHYTFEWTRFQAYDRERAARAFMTAFEPVESTLNPELARPGARVRPSGLAERQVA
jgi:hypothetical protein